jgi:hypothetical protein
MAAIDAVAAAAASPRPDVSRRLADAVEGPTVGV